MLYELHFKVYIYIFTPSRTSVQFRRLLQNDASARFDAGHATHNLLIDAQASNRGNSGMLDS